MGSIGCDPEDCWSRGALHCLSFVAALRLSVLLLQTRSNSDFDLICDELQRLVGALGRIRLDETGLERRGDETASTKSRITPLVAAECVIATASLALTLGLLPSKASKRLARCCHFALAAHIPRAREAVDQVSSEVQVQVQVEGETNFHDTDDWPVKPRPHDAIGGPLHAAGIPLKFKMQLEQVLSKSE